MKKLLDILKLVVVVLMPLVVALVLMFFGVLQYSKGVVLLAVGYTVLFIVLAVLDSMKFNKE